MNTDYGRNGHWLWSPSVPPGWDRQIVTGRAATAAWEPTPARGRIPCMLLLLHQGPWCHPGDPPRPFCTLPAATRSFPCSQQEWAVIPFPKKAAGCSGWTAGLNQRGESHVNLKNIKMITSSRVTFLFIYRISQLCMTNFAQSHYLEQFV